LSGWDVLLPPIGGVVTATHGDVDSSPMVGRIFSRGRLDGGVVCLPTSPVKPVDVMGLPQVVVVTVHVVSVAGSDVAGEMDVGISPTLPDGLPLMVGDMPGSLAGGVLSGGLPLVLRPPANCDVGLPVALDDVRSRAVRRACTALFSTGALADLPTTPSLDVIVGGGPVALFLRRRGLPTPPGWHGVPSSSDEDDRISSIP